MAICLLKNAPVQAQATPPSTSQENNAAKKITLGFDNADILTVFNRISEKTRLKFTYNNDDLDRSKKVTLDKKERTVSELLSQVGLQSGLDFRVDKDNILVKPVAVKTSESVAGGESIRGTVRTTNGDPLPGATVKLRNAANGMATDESGKFQLKDLPASAVLEISLVGYDPVIEPLNGRSQLDVVLMPTSRQMEQVVVIGYGTQRKKDVIGAVSSVNTKNMEKLTGANVAGMLQGQVAGVNAAPGSGDPGAAPVVLVRGLSTINNNEPLYVIDGIPGDINAINPADIQSIDVLKDASAATIYGSRASNGVIMVTTRRGRSGKILIGINTYYGVSQLAKKLPLTNRVQYNSILKQVAANDGSDPLDYVMSDTYEDDNGQILPYPDNDWQSEFFRTAPENKIDVSVSGGTKDMRMNVSFGRYAQDGIAIETSFERYNLQVNSDLTKGKFKFGESFTFSKTNRRLLQGSNESRSNGQNAGYPLIYEMLNRVPHHKLYDPENDGGYGARIGSQMTDAVNPVGYQNLVTSRDQPNYFIGNVYGEYQILKPLSFKLQYGFNSADGYSYTHIPTYYMGAKVQNPTAQLYEFRDRRFRDVVNAVFTFNKILNDVHSINAVGGYSQENEKYKSLSGSDNNLPSNDLGSLDGGIGDKGSGGALLESSLRSWFARLNYSYDGKYLFGATVRRDGSSRFSDDNKYGTFYSVSGAWRVSDEKFFKDNIGSVSELKLRGSYGILGNQGIPDYLYLPPTVTTGGPVVNYPFGAGLRQAVAVGAIVTKASSPDIRWEQSATFNAGFDLSVLNERLLLIVDYFRTKTTDMLVKIPLPPSTGLLENPIMNAGEMQNQGVDIAVTYRKYQGDLKFDITANVSMSRNKILKLGFADEAFEDGYMDYNNFPTTRTEVGGEIGRFYLFQTAGVIKTEKELEDVKVLQPNAQLGDIRFVDINKDGELNDDDRTYMGSGLPRVEYGLTTNFSYQHFDLNIFFQGTQGNHMYNGAKRLMYQNNIFNKSTDLLNAWTTANSGSNIPRVTEIDANLNMGRPSDLFLEKGSYLRLKSMQLGYRFNVKGFNVLRAYVGATNLFTITNYSGYDPGVVNYSSFARGVDRGLYPLSRSFFAGLNVEF
ncbi:putative TonB-dependent receptor [Flavihumibacter petaseus NBRC 106054]|uniref:Putative TonB-dependent receptor n=2 Tax=Flavihumibacter TaxID=1004301 RepID=A0A0E9N332_9BACT|nr:putative TonB-dependent receptor [Flavihumibacter petaseus NBRC 106054]